MLDFGIEARDPVDLGQLFKKSLKESFAAGHQFSIHELFGWISLLNSEARIYGFTEQPYLVEAKQGIQIPEHTKDQKDLSVTEYKSLMGNLKFSEYILFQKNQPSAPFNFCLAFPCGVLAPNFCEIEEAKPLYVPLDSIVSIEPSAG